MPEHLNEVRARRLEWVSRTRTAVQVRLTKETTYWDLRAAELRLWERSGTANVRLAWQEAQRRAHVLQLRLWRRLEELDRETEPLGYDMESRVPGMGKLCFIEVKGRSGGAETVTVTRNEVLY